MRAGAAVRLLALLALAAAPAAGAQQFLLPEALSPDGLNRDSIDLDSLGLDGGGRTAATRPGDRVQRAQEIAVTAATGGVLRGLDRISGETTDMELAVGAQASFGNGRITVSLLDCRYPQDDPSSNAYAYVTVQDRLRDAPVFQGWMVAASPALNALDHPRYDVWVLRCNSS